MVATRSWTWRLTTVYSAKDQPPRFADGATRRLGDALERRRREDKTDDTGAASRRPDACQTQWYGYGSRCHGLGARRKDLSLGSRTCNARVSMLTGARVCQ